MIPKEDVNLRPGQPGVGEKIYRVVQTTFRIVLGDFLIFSGTSHLTVARAEFLAQVPT